MGNLRTAYSQDYNANLPISEPDDGNMSDINADAVDLYECLGMPEDYDRYGSPGSCALDDANFRIPNPETGRDLVPTFCTYINYDLDTIYVHPSHCCSPEAVANCIESLTLDWQDNSLCPSRTLRRIAFNMSHIRDNTQFDAMTKYVEWLDTSNGSVFIAWSLQGDILTISRDTEGIHGAWAAYETIYEYISSRGACPTAQDEDLKDEFVEACLVAMDDTEHCQNAFGKKKK